MIKASELRMSMILDEDVRGRNGVLFAAKGQEVTLTVLRRLQAFAQGVGVIEPFRVRIPATCSSPCEVAS
jgi:hypothetical protein